MALWTPASTTTAAWFDASDASTITDSGGAVSQWNDKSGNSYNLTQGTGAAQPVTGSSTINSLNAMTWTAAKFMSSATPAAANWQDVYIVGKWTGAGTFSEYSGLITGVNNSGSSSGIGWLGHSGSVNAFTGGKWWDNFYLNGTSSTGAAVLPTMASDFVVDFSANSTISVAGMMVGRDRTYSTRGWVGLIGEVIAFNSKLSTADRQKTEGYLAWKWGTEGSLPAAHPYKSAAPTQIGITSVTPATGPGATTTSVTIAGTDFLTAVGPVPSYYWKFNDNAASTTVVAATGSQNATASVNTSVMSVAGVTGTALQCQSSGGQGITVPSGTTYITSATFSMSIWIYPDSVSGTGSYVWDSTVANGKLYLIRDNQTLRGGVNFGAGGATSFTTGNVLTSASQWYHVVYVQDGTNSVVYVNASSVATGTGDQTPAISTNGLRIGTQNTGSGSYFGGRVDDFAIWNGTALSATEVASVYSSGTPPDITSGTPASSATVTIGGYPCTSVSVASAISLTCNTPLSYTAGARDVVATNSTGTATLAGGFTYAAPLLDRQQIGSVFQDWRRSESVDSIGSVFQDWRRSESVHSIGSVFTDERNAETVEGLGSVMGVPALPSTVGGLPAPSYYWRFNTGSGTTATAAVGGRDGTTANAPWVTGVQGDALDYKYISGSRPITTFPTPSTYFSSAVYTISMWINRVSNRTYGYFLNHNSNDPSIDSGSGGSGYVRYIVNGSQQFSVDSGIGLGVWYHLCIVSTGSDVILYINGVNTHSKGSAGPQPVMTTGTLNLGNYEPASTYQSDAKIDEFAIWDGTGLSASGVANVYGSGTPPDITTGITGGANPTKHYVLYTPPPFKPDVIWF